MWEEPLIAGAHSGDALLRVPLGRRGFDAELLMRRQRRRRRRRRLLLMSDPRGRELPLPPLGREPRGAAMVLVALVQVAPLARSGRVLTAPAAAAVPRSYAGRRSPRGHPGRRLCGQ